MKIALHSVPRSGSSWIGQIFNSSPKVNYKYQPLFSFAFKDYLTPNSSKKEIDSFFSKISNSSDSFINQTEQITNGSYPKFHKDKDLPFIIYKEVRYHQIIENLLAQDPELIVIGLIRNPLSVISSWLQAPKEFRADLGWNELDQWRYAKLKNQGKAEEFNGYEKWKEVALLFHRLKKQYPKRVYILNYQKVLENTSSEIRDIFNFCGIPITDQTLQFINKSSHSNNNNGEDAYSVYRNKQTDDKWKEQLNPIIAEEIISDLNETELEVYLSHD
jgi:hypothetical protein